MKILIATGIYPPSIGGPATYSKLLFDELPSRGIEVKIVSYDDVRKYPKGISHLIYFFKVFLAGIRKDAIYAMDPVSVGFPAMIASRLLGKRFVLKIVGDYAWEQGTQLHGISDTLDDFVKISHDGKVGHLEKIQKRVAKEADKIIVPSRYLKKIVSQWGVDENKITVIYNAFESSINEITKSEAKNNLNVESPCVISIGRLVPWKGFRALIEIMRDLLNDFPNLKLYIAGEGPDRKELSDLITKLNLEKSVSLLGALPKEKLFEYISASDLFVLNTNYEGFSHQLLEVLSLNRPIVTTSAGGNPELIVDGESGILIEYNDKKALIESIGKILKDHDYGKKLSDEGKKVVSSFSIDRMLNETESELKNML